MDTFMPKGDLLKAIYHANEKQNLFNVDET